MYVDPRDFTVGPPMDSWLPRFWLVERDVRNCFPQPLVLQLKPLQLLELVSAHTAIVLAPAFVSTIGLADENVI